MGLGYFRDYGAVSEACMPYQADDDVPCTDGPCTKIATTNGWLDIPNDEAGDRFGTHTTAEASRRYQELRREVYGTAANPHYVVLSPEGERLADSGYTGDLNEFLDFLRTGEP